MILFLQATMQGLALGAVYSLVAIGLVLIYKATDVLSFAQPALAVAGAGIISALAVDRGISFWIALPLAIFITGIIGLIIERNNEGRGNNYSRAMWGYDANYSSGEVYNCVIREVYSNRTMSHIYDNGNSGDREMYYCSIDADMESAYTCGTSTAGNIAFTDSSDSFCGNLNNATYNVSFQDSPSSALPYYLTSGASANSSFGVYGGYYAWPS